MVTSRSSIPSGTCWVSGTRIIPVLQMLKMQGSSISMAELNLGLILHSHNSGLCGQSMSTSRISSSRAVILGNFRMNFERNYVDHILIIKDVCLFVYEEIGNKESSSQIQGLLC